MTLRLFRRPWRLSRSVLARPLIPAIIIGSLFGAGVGTVVGRVLTSLLAT